MSYKEHKMAPSQAALCRSHGDRLTALEGAVGNLRESSARIVEKIEHIEDELKNGFVEMNSKLDACMAKLTEVDAEVDDLQSTGSKIKAALKKFAVPILVIAGSFALGAGRDQVLQIVMKVIGQ
jgi:chromosome segregation ATPase